MARTRIEDLPKDIKIGRKEMGRTLGGVNNGEVVFGESGGTAQGEGATYDGIPIEVLDDLGILCPVGARIKKKKAKKKTRRPTGLAPEN